MIDFVQYAVNINRARLNLVRSGMQQYDIRRVGGKPCEGLCDNLSYGESAMAFMLVVKFIGAVFQRANEIHIVSRLPCH